MTTDQRDNVAQNEAADVGILARGHTGDVIARLKEWLGGDDARSSLAAAAMLLDRGWGKVEARADPTVAPASVVRLPMVAEDIETWLQQKAPSQAG